MATRCFGTRSSWLLQNLLPSTRKLSRSLRIHSSLRHREKKLFTPGPLGVSETTKRAMLKDLGSRDEQFIALVRSIRDKVVDLAGVSRDTFTCVPMQGSGTFAIEAVLSTTVPRDGKVLILENGAYGKRQAKICDAQRIAYHVESFQEDEKVNVERVRTILEQEKSFSNVTIVHCETSSGVINPVEDIGHIVKEFLPGASYFVDAMSSFGAIHLDLEEAGVNYLVTSANKCLEGVPGFSFALCRTSSLMTCRGYARSYCLDLLDQYESLEKTGQFRFTPPTHAMLAFRQALNELDQEGGISGRSHRYQENREVLRSGMATLGFKEFLDDGHTGYIITSYCFPTEPNFNFMDFYHRLSDKGQLIYPGKVLDSDCFRIGNIGHLFPKDMRKLLECIEDVCLDMGMTLPLDSRIQV